MQKQARRSAEGISKQQQQQVRHASVTCKRCGSSKIDTTYEGEQRGDIMYHWVIDSCASCGHVSYGRSY